MSRISRQKIEAIQEANIKLLGEQDENSKGTIQIQKFLNKKEITDDEGNTLEEDGLAGKATEEAISKYQTSLRVYPVDGVWGRDIMGKMPPADRKLYDSLSSWW